MPLYSRVTHNHWGLRSMAEALGKGAAGPAVAAVSQLPAGWQSGRDAKGRTYYYNVGLRTSQWDPPPAPG